LDTADQALDTADDSIDSRTTDRPGGRDASVNHATVGTQCVFETFIWAPSLMAA